MRIYLNYREIVEDPRKVLNDASAFVSKICNSANIKGECVYQRLKIENMGASLGACIWDVGYLRKIYLRVGKMEWFVC